MRREKIASYIITFVLLFLAIVWIYPYLWLFISSFKPAEDIFTTFLPKRLTLEHYRFIFVMANRFERPFVRAFFNSLFISSTVTFSVIFTSMLIGYAISRINFKIGKAVFNFIIYQMLFPGFMFTIPMFILIRAFGWLNTYQALIVPSLTSSWGIFMFAQNFKSIPQDYIDAAKIDGANNFWIVLRIMLPLSRSTASIVGLFTFIGVWDNFLWPLMVMKDYKKMPLSVLLASFNHEYASYIGPVLAGAVIQTIPMVIIFLTLRNYFLQGISMSLR
ncbi:carbohydrate ABC transporter membrane protein 2, CUT1 family [Fervidobacterium pennivorans DSM 9078]|jgi:multiple sugar transport system permease protein|uniref:Carbohydrate ABC transporter membrane protein 2, CUT1 family n=1 Tax=Fervidobacterium pennivorans (strain DSM 9078 / Ven5) TaxID=771875 RepID=H9UE86_FERPD|nr:carbohydrate ABC transporter permease [Fervidobacterium pennivorans]AFG35829.1 carbohydrate ABC transporter membrane protein 2, CUT1 family [Fervidobacterium pennivorans DSM 9078]QIV78604.1 carbohydrate ABC transporter permease [Fervidobacterium pennivorans subsp. keratinolyticus]